MKDPTTWAQRRLQIAERYMAIRNQRDSYLLMYSKADFDRIAKAVRKSADEIRTYRLSFEACAFWYRAGHGFGMKRPKQLPPSKMHERVSRIHKAADRLLRAFEVRSDADDGMGEGALGQQIFEALTWAGPAEAEAVAQEIRKLDQARQAATDLLKRAKAAAADIKASELKSYSKKGKVTSKGPLSVPDGNQSDDVLNDWMACSMRLYVAITGERLKTSVRSSPDKQAGEADGPLIRFLLEAGRPLGIQQSKKALRARVRRLLKDRKRRLQRKRKQRK